MPRLKQQTVEYFPHLCIAGTTIHTLQTKYGNDGYAFWFKLLELLATKDGHYYNFETDSRWDYLLAKTNVPEDKAHQILDTLASLDAIDPELYHVQILWVQHLVDNLAEVYRRRQAGLPQRPDPVTRQQPHIETPAPRDNHNSKEQASPKTKETHPNPFQK